MLALVLYRQLRTRSVDERRMYTVPLVLAVVAVAQGGLIDSGHLAPSLGLFAGEAVAAVGLGVLRAVTVRLWREHDGTLWRRGTGWTLAAWLVSVAIRAAFVGAGYAAGTKPALRRPAVPRRDAARAEPRGRPPSAQARRVRTG